MAEKHLFFTGTVLPFLIFEARFKERRHTISSFVMKQIINGKIERSMKKAMCKFHLILTRSAQFEKQQPLIHVNTKHIIPCASPIALRGDRDFFLFFSL